MKEHLLAVWVLGSNLGLLIDGSDLGHGLGTLSDCLGGADNLLSVLLDLGDLLFLLLNQSLDLVSASSLLLLSHDLLSLDDLLGNFAGGGGD